MDSAKAEQVDESGPPAGILVKASPQCSPKELAARIRAGSVAASAQQSADVLANALVRAQRVFDQPMSPLRKVLMLYQICDGALEEFENAARASDG